MDRTDLADPILVDRRGAAVWITLHRPDRLNALDDAMVDQLADAVAAAGADDDVQVIVLRGAGRGFCSGLDLKSAFGTGAPGTGIARLPELVVAIHEAPQPVIALVHGAACGGGFAIALAADVRLAGASARMNDAFITLGLSGCELGLSHLLPRDLGRSVSAELMLTGRFVDADRALRLGLVSEVVPDDELEAAGEALVADLVRNTPMGLRKTKETLRRVAAMDDLAAVIELEAAVQAECAQEPHFLARIEAFRAAI